MGGGLKQNNCLWFLLAIEIKHKIYSAAAIVQSMSSSKRTEKANWLAFEIKIRDAYTNIADAPRQFYKLRGQATLL